MTIQMEIVRLEMKKQHTINFVNDPKSHELIVKVYSKQIVEIEETIKRLSAELENRK